MIKCPNCEGEMKFDVKLQKVKCEYCGSVFEPGEINANIKTSEETNSYEGKAYRCSQCGAELLTFDDTAITFCSYCGSQAMIEDKMLKHNNPDFIIPFKKTKEECVNAYKNKVSKFFFAPKYMKSDLAVEKFRGIYMPYGIFNVSKKGIVKNKGTKYAYRRGDYVYYNDYEINADIDATYDGISYDLVSKFYDNYSTAIPFNYMEAVPFNSDYLTGYYADSFDVGVDVYKDIAEEVVMPDARAKLKKNAEFGRYGCSNPKVYFDVASKIGMFPTYFLSMRDKKNKNINYAIVNGQTGKVAADLPIDFKKYILVSLVLAITIFLLINPSLVLSPTKVSVFSAIAALISFFISYKQVKKIEKKEMYSDDAGMKAATDNKKKIKKGKRRLRFLYKEVIAFIITLLPIWTSAINDSFFYGSAIISLILIVFSFYDLVKEHNLLASNKLPQLEKRGGDENE